MKLLLLRHAETINNTFNKFNGQIESPYSKQGLNEVKLAKEKLKNENFEIIYSSPLERCKILANEINEYHNKKIVYDDRLKELYFGKLEGKTQEEFKKLYPELYETWKKDKTMVTFPSGENYHELEKRVVSFLNEVIKKDEDCIFVTHRGVIRILTKYLLDLPLTNLWNIEFPNICLVEYEIAVDRNILIKIN